MAFLCAVGLHDGDWYYIGSSCQQTRTCLRCGITSTREWHDTSLVEEPGKGRVHLCSRCGNKEPENTYDGFHYVS
jgi:hypothetical protein